MVQIPDHLMESVLNVLMKDNEDLKAQNTALCELLSAQMDKLKGYNEELLKLKQEVTNYKANSPKIIPEDLVRVLSIMAGWGEGSIKINLIKYLRELFPQLSLLESKQLSERLLDRYEVKGPPNN